jgi:hypothetical protein
MSLVIDDGRSPLAAAVAPMSATSPRVAWMTTAGLLSLGAGAIHAAAIGVHAEHRPAALAFTAVAALQLCWGGLALVRANRPNAVVGVLLGVGAFAGWVVAKTAGISFIEGLDVAEPVQAADAVCAGLALTSAIGAGFATRARATAFAVPRVPMSLIAGVVAAVSVFGMTTAGTHVHAHGTAGHSDAAGVADDHSHATGDDHANADAAAMDHSNGAMDHGNGAPPASGATAAANGGEHAHVESAVAPVPYDPTKPIDLGGVPGVTPEQQAAAENLVAVTLVKLPQWSDPNVALAAGFHSIGDGVTGIEHFVNEAWIDDDVILDPDKPESLVYSTSGGKRKLVAAMYMVRPGTPLSDVPNIGGPLMQWHIHDNLCYTPDHVLGGLTDAKGNCAPGLTKPVPAPMIHVWITAHRCGPFAALEGIGGGTIEDGETRLCDHAHGK